MALVDNAHYVNFGDGATTGYWGVTKWAANTVYAAGDIRRPTGQSVGVTMTSANPGVVTWRDNAGTALAHNFVAGDTVVFTTTGALPTNVVAGTTYYVVATVTSTTFSIASTPGGTAINTTAGTQSGVHTGTGMHVGNERVYICVVAGTSAVTLEPVWTFTRGVKITDNTATWQECTGIAAINGDATNTPSWTITATPPGGVKGTAVTLGQVIKRDSGASYQICSTAGTAGSGSEPAFSNTAGTTTADNTVTWTSLGVVGNFTGWQAPHARLANAFTSTWGQAGNRYFAASEHSETQATAITLTAPLSGVNFCEIYCTTKTNLPPQSGDVTTGAIIATAGATNITVRGEAVYDGITFNCGSGANSATLQMGGSNTQAVTVFRNCVFALTGTGTAARLSYGGNTEVDTYNCTLSFSNASQTINIAGRTYINGGSLSGTAPTSLIGRAVDTNSFMYMRGMDLSLCTSGSTLMSGNDRGFTYTIEDCKLGASVAIASLGGRSSQFDVINCDSGATNYRHERYQGQGTQSVETTIVRTGGATNGTTAIAWKIVTSNQSKWDCPFISLPISIWNSSTASLTVTMYGIWGGAAVPNNDDIWIEAEYLGSGSTPLGSFTTATKSNNLATGSALSSDTSTWGGSTTKFAMTLTFAPGMAGPINLVVKAAKASSTFYIDPQPEINGVPVWRSYALAPGVYANERMIGRAGMQDIGLGIAA